MDWHTTDAGLIPRCGEGFSHHGQLSVHRLSYEVCTSPCAITCIKICMHVKDPVVHIRVWWSMITLKHPACTIGWVAPLSRSLLSLGKTPLCAVACIVNICVHSKHSCSPCHCQSWVDYEKTEAPSMHCRLASATLVAAGFPWGKQPKFPT